MGLMFPEYDPSRLAGLYSNGDDFYHPKDIEAIHRLTAPSRWDFSQFKNVLISLARVGHLVPLYIPSCNVPDSIHLGSLRKYVTELKDLQAQIGSESSRVFFVDRDKSELVAGRRTVGTWGETHLDWTTLIFGNF